MSIYTWCPEKSETQLIEQLSSRNSKERLWAVMALKERKSLEAIPHLGRILLTDTEAANRHHTAIALGVMKSENSVPYLIQAAHDESAGIREGVATALGYLGRDIGANEQMVIALVRFLGDSDDNVMQYAASAVGRVGSFALPFLVEKLRDNNSDERLKVGIVWALGFLRETVDTQPNLIEALRTGSSDVQKQALYMLYLGRYRLGESLRPFLMPFTNDPDEMVCSYARELFDNLVDGE